MQLLFKIYRTMVGHIRQKTGSYRLRAVYAVSLLLMALLVQQIAVGRLLPDIKGAWRKAMTDHLSASSSASRMRAATPPVPGGVTGSLLWLRADDAASNGGSWKDYTGNGVAGTQANAALKPVVNDGALNFNYAYVFNGTSYLQIPLNSIKASFPFANAPRTIIAVGAPSKTLLSGDHAMMFAYGETGDGTGTYIGMVAGGDGRASFGGYSAGGNYNIIMPAGTMLTNGTYIMGGRYDGSNSFLDLNATMIGSITGAVWKTKNTQDAVIGRGSIMNQTNPSYWQGKTAEIIVYDHALNAAEQQRVYSYLSLKYGVTMNKGAQNYLASDGSTFWRADATYKNRITGIGRDDVNGLNTKQSLNIDTGMVTMSLGNGIAPTNSQNTNVISNDKSFLVLADNGQATSIYNYAVPGKKVTYRMPRIWKVNKTNWSDQSVTLKADVPGNSVYLLISRTDPNFGTIDQELLLNPDKTITLNSSLIPDGAYVTFATFVKYPGGVPGALLWLRPDIGISNVDNTPVSTWADYAYNNNATQTTATLQPKYMNNPADNVNYNPVVKFDGVNYLSLDANKLPLATSPRTFIGTGFINTGGNGNKYILAYGGRGTGLGMGLASVGGIGAFVGFNDYLGTPVNPFWQPGQFNEFTALWAGNSASIFSKGVGLANTAKMWNTTAGTGAGIGGTPWGTNEYWNGPIGDIIVYNNVVVPNDRQRIYTYLAIKYGYTLDQTTPTNYIATDGTTKVWTASVNTVYNKNITGIGRDDTEDLMQKQSRSINPGLHPIIGLGNIAATNTANANAFPTDLSYLVWGDDGGATTFSVTVTGRPDVKSRMARLWKVQQTGTVGTVQIAIPKDSLPAVFSKVYLAISPDAVIDGTDQFIQLTETNINGVTCYTTTANLMDGQYFTFAAMGAMPGGVSGNTLWVRADMGVQVNAGNQVQQWFDQGGSGNATTELRASAPTSNDVITPSADIIQTQGAINFNPAVTFTGAINKSLKGNAASSWKNSDPLAMFFVALPKGAPGSDLGGIFSTNTSGRGVLINSTGTGYVLDGNGCTPALTSSSLAKPHVGRGMYISAANAQGGSTWLNGKLETTAGSCGTGADNSYFEVGGRTPDGLKGRIYNGHLAEVIVYKAALTPAQAQQIESYLAIKYGVTLDQSTAQHYLAADGTTKVWDATANSVYKNNIFGIGRDDTEKLYQKQSRSVNDGAILTIGSGNIATTNAGNTNSINSDKSYLMLGSNSVAKTVQSANLPVASCITERLTQQWKAQLTNFDAATQPLRLQFDLAGVNATGSTLSDFVLLIDQDGDGNFATGTITQIPATDYNAGVVGFDNVMELTNGAVFTLATRYPVRTASLVPAGQVKTAANICVDGDWVYFRHPDDINKYIAAIQLNGNTIDVSKLSAVIDANRNMTAIGKNAGTDYGTQLMNRFLQITYTGVPLTTNGGVTLRLFWNPAEKTAAENYLSSTRGVTRPQKWIWFKHDNNIDPTLTDLDARGLKNITTLTPAASGQVDGVDYVDFQGIQQLSTFGGETTSDVVYTDLAITKDDGKTTYTPGTDVVYTVVVSNLATDAVTGATIQDKLPVGIPSANMNWQVSATTGGGNVAVLNGTGALNQQIDLPGGATITYTVTISVPSAYTGDLVNTATVAVPATGYVDIDPVNNTATDTDTYQPEVNLHIIKTATPDPASAGNAIDYTITVTNAGKSDVAGATITDMIPAGISNVTWTATATGTGATVSPASGTGNVSAVATVPGSNNGTVTILVKGVLSPDYTGATLSNTASVTPPAGITDTDPVDNVSTISTAVEKKTSVIITKVNATSTKVAGSPVTYRITVGNNGPATATGVRIQDQVPANVAISGVVPSVAGAATITANNTAGSNVDVIANIPPGPTNYVAIEITGTIDPSFSGALTNTATATSPDGAPVSATDKTDIIRKPILLISKNGPATIVSGADITYVITVANSGLSNAVNANIFDMVPANISNVSWTTAVEGAAHINSGATGTGNSVNVYADIPAGAANKVTVTVTGTVSPAATGNIDNTVSLTPTEANVPLLNAIASTTVNKTPQLAISKNGPATVVAGETISYTLFVTNPGKANADGVDITDDLPAGITNVSWTATATGGAAVTAGATGTGNTVAVKGNIPAGVNANISVQVTGIVDPALPIGSLLNEATVTSAEAGKSWNSSVSTTVSRVANVGIVKSGPADRNAGQDIQYKLKVTNAGPSIARAAQIFDNVPAEIKNVNWTATVTGGAAILTNPTGATNNVYATVDIPVGGEVNIVINGTVTGAVPVGATMGITNTATVNVAGGTTDPDTGNNTSRRSTTLTNTADLLVSKSGPQRVNIGDPITYVIDVSNLGTGDVPAALIDDVIPAAVTVLNWTATASNGADIGGVGTATGTTSPIHLTANMPGNTNSKVSIVVNGTVNSSAGASFTNQAQVDAGGNTKFSKITTAVNQSTDVKIQKAGPVTIAAGQDIAYTLTVTNAGPLDANNINITDNVPVQIENIKWTATAAGTSTVSAGSGTGNISLTGDIKTGDANAITIHITGRVKSDVMVPNIQNTATVTLPSGGVIDYDLSNNTATATTNVTLEPGVRLVKVGPATAIGGTGITYSIEVNNDGPSDVINLNIADLVPAAVSNVKWVATATGNATLISGNTGAAQQVNVKSNIPAGAGNKINITITGTVDPAFAGTITNVATASAPMMAATVSSNNVVTSISRQVDIAVAKSASKTTVNAGEALDFTITVTNIGPGTLKAGEELQLTENLPAGLGNVSLIPSGIVYNPVTGAYTLTSDMVAGSTVKLVVSGIVVPNYTGTSITNHVEVAAPAGVSDPDLTNNQADAVAATRLEADLGITKVSDKNIVVAGDPLTYTITVKNYGPGAFNSGDILKITESLPAELQNVTYNATGGVYDSNTHSFTLTGGLNAGSSVQLVVSGTVAADFIGTGITNTVSVAPQGMVTDPVPGNNTSNATVAVERKADLAVTKTVDKTSVVAGEAINYTITIKNKGVSTLKSGEVLRITETLPAELIVNGYDVTGGIYDANAGTLTLTSDLSQNAVVTLVIKGNVSATTLSTSMINKVSVSVPAGITDSDLTNNTATSPATAIRRETDLMITKSVDKTSAVAGEAITYTITVQNNGISTLKSGEKLGLTETLPAELIVGSYTATGGIYDASTNTFTLTGDLAKDGVVTLVIRGNIDAGTLSASMVNKVTVTVPSGVTDIDPSNNTATSNATTIRRESDLAVTKTVDKTSAVAGEAITYTITIQNKGISTLKSGEKIGITETLPAELIVASYVATGGTYDASAGTFTLTSDLAKDGIVTLIVKGNVDAATSSTSMVNKVAVTAPTGVTDTDPSNNAATSNTTAIRRESDLAVTKTVDKTSAVAGEAITYTVTVLNKGTSTLKSGEVIGIAETLPAELIVSGYTATGGTYNANTGTFTLSSDMAQNGVISLTISGNADPGTLSTSMVNKVAVTVPSGVTDTDLSNNTVTSNPTTIRRESDLAVTKTVDKTSAVAGEAISYTITVQNKGISTLKSGEVIGITETLPTELIIDSYDATGGAYDANAGTFTLSMDLAQNETVTLVIKGNVDAATRSTSMFNKVSVTIPAGVTETDPSNNTATSNTTTIRRESDLAVTKQVDKTSAMAGEAINYTITIQNKGISTLRSGEVISITETLPAELIVSSYDATGGTYDANAGTFTLTSDLLKNGAVTLVIKGNVNAATTSTSMMNKVSVTLPSGITESDPSNNTATSNTTAIRRESDLAVTKHVDKTSVVAGEAINYTITIQNKGLSTLKSGEAIGISETLPAALIVNGYTATGGSYDANAHTFTLTSDLAKDGAVTLLINGEVDPAATATSMINKVSVTVPNGITDTDQSNNTTTSETTTIIRESDLEVTKQVDKTSAVTGDVLNYTITVGNKGLSTLNTGEVITITETLPAGLTNISYLANGGTYNTATRAYTLTGPMASGGAVTLKISGTIAADFTGSAVTNKVAIATPAGISDPVTANNEATVTTNVSRVADLAVNKSADKPEVAVGRPLNYTITVTNHGPATMNNGETITITEALPAALTNVGFAATGGNYNASTGAFQLTSVLPVGGTIQLNVSGTIDAAYTGSSITNNVAIAAGITDPDNSNNTASVTTGITPPPSFETWKTVTTEYGTGQIHAGEKLTYTIYVRNNGKVPLPDVTITDPVPAHTSYVSGGALKGNIVNFSIKDLAPGATTSVTFVVKADDNLTGISGISNTATVSDGYITKPTAGCDPAVPGCDINTPGTNIETGGGDLSITKEVVTPQAPYRMGQQVTYRITVHNAWDQTFTNVAVEDLLPAGLEAPTSTTADKGKVQTDQAGKRMLWDIGQLMAGETLQMTLVCRVIDGGQVVNQARVTANEPQINLTNDLAEAVIQVEGQDLSFPNVFTPNGDGKNEKFIIGGLEKYPGSALYIYNRWGSMVYQSKDYKNDWNGSGLNEGTYYYILEVRKPQETKRLKGWVQILR
nr:gliding motility-associated C-terminal domain-containing protein [Chitinophaga flava]